MAYQSIYSDKRSKKLRGPKAIDTSNLDYRSSKNDSYTSPTKDYRSQQLAQKMTKQQVNNTVQKNAKQNVLQKIASLTESGGKTVAKGGKALAKDATSVASKSYHTVAAGAEGVAGLTRLGNAKDKGKTAAEANKAVDANLKKSYLTPKQAASRGGGVKSLKENFIKPTSQAVADITPYVAPIGKTAKGAKLVTKVVKGAVDNAAVTAGTTIGNETVQGRIRKDNGGEIAKQVATAALVGGAIPLAGKAVSKVTSKPDVTSSKVAVGQQAIDKLTAQKENLTKIKAEHPNQPKVDEAISNLDKKITEVQKVNDKATLETQKTTEKNTAEIKKIDDQVELLQAKKKDAGELSNVDKTKMKQLKVQKKELQPEGADDAPKGLDGKPLEVVDGDVILYHNTTKEAAQSIRKDGQLDPKRAGTGNDKAVSEDGRVSYASTKPRDFYGEEAVKVRMPVEEYRKALQKEAETVAKLENEIATGKIPEMYVEDTRRQIQNIKEHPEILSDKPLKVFSEEKPKPETPKTPSKPDANASRVYQRLQAEHPELTDDVSYQATTLKKDAEKAVTVLAEDKQKAFRIAMGQEKSADVTSTSTNIAMAEKALEEGNHALYARLVKNRSLEQTRRGQELVAEKGSITDNSTSRYVKELIGMKLDKAGKNYLGDVRDRMGKTGPRERATKAVDREVNKLERQIRNRRLDTKTALALLDKIECQ